MPYVPGVRYIYKCGCGWSNALEDGLVPYMLIVRCPRCGRDASAERVDDAVGVPVVEVPRLCSIEFLMPL